MANVVCQRIRVHILMWCIGASACWCDGALVCRCAGTFMPQTCSPRKRKQKLTVICFLIWLRAVFHNISAAARICSLDDSFGGVDDDDALVVTFSRYLALASARWCDRGLAHWGQSVSRCVACGAGLWTTEDPEQNTDQQQCCQSSCEVASTEFR